MGIICQTNHPSEAKLENIETTHEENLLIQQANRKALKNWLAECALAELRAADTIASHGIRALSTESRIELAQLCGFHGIPIDGTIGYTQKRHEALQFMAMVRQIHLRNTIRHLKIAHKVIKLISSIASDKEKGVWTIANDRAGLFSEETTRSQERLVVIEKWNEVKGVLYTKKEAA